MENSQPLKRTTQEIEEHRYLVGKKRLPEPNWEREWHEAEEELFGDILGRSGELRRLAFEELL